MKKKNIFISTLTPLVLSSAVLPLVNAINVSQTKNINYLKTSESSASIIDKYGTKWDVKFYDAEKEENRYCEVISFVVGFNKAKEEQLVNKVIIPEKFTFEEKDYKLTKISNCILGTGVKQIEFLTFFNAKNLVEIADNCFKNIKIKKISWVGCYSLKTIGNHAFDGVGVVATAEDNIIDLSATVLETIGDYAFYNFSVDDEETEKNPTRNAWRVILPRTLTKIGDYAFSGETKTVTDKKKQIIGIIEVAVGAISIATSIYSFAKTLKTSKVTNRKLDEANENLAIAKEKFDELNDEHRAADAVYKTSTKMRLEIKDKIWVESSYQRFNNNEIKQYRNDPDAFKEQYAENLENTQGLTHDEAVAETADYVKQIEDQYNSKYCPSKFAEWQKMQEDNIDSFLKDSKKCQKQMQQIGVNLAQARTSLNAVTNDIDAIKAKHPVLSNQVLQKCAGVFEVVLGTSGAVALGFGINNLVNCKYTVDKSIQFASIECLNPEKPTFGKNWAPRGLNLNQNSSIIAVPKANSSALNSNPLQDYLNAPNATYKADGKIENTGKDITPAMYQESKIWFDETSNNENVYKLSGYAGASSTNEFSWKANHVQEKCAHKENQFIDSFGAKIYNHGEMMDKYHACYSLSRAPENVFIDGRTGKISWSNELQPGTYHFNVNADLYEYVSDPQNPGVLMGPEYSSYVARAQSKEITLTILPSSKLLQIQTPSTITKEQTALEIYFNGKREFDFDYGDSYLKTTLITDHPDKIKIEGEKIIIDPSLESGTTFTLNVERRFIIGTTNQGTSFKTKILKQTKDFVYKNN